MRSDHGSGEEAIEWLLNHGSVDDRLQAFEFLSAWDEGNLDEWPEYYEWLDAKRAKEEERGRALAGEVA